MTATCTCDRRWTSPIEAHCRICHQHFSTPETFDRHQANRHGCPDPATLRDGNGNPVLRSVDRGTGPTWVGWKSEEHRAAIKQRFRPETATPREG